MIGVLVKDLYIARSNILVTIVSLVVLGLGLSFLLETSALLVLAPVEMEQKCHYHAGVKKPDYW